MARDEKHKKKETPVTLSSLRAKMQTEKILASTNMFSKIKKGIERKLADNWSSFTSDFKDQLK
jgi:hypothetical protein